ncbi:MAG: hypothetical protein AUI93_02930 [Crenarchaeota archaeon 13_1_40CM_3_52_10]|nr:MAG: hypothetical protein AUI93_02930 [Crenarchaeota archaeon 13_1_40CM_3_52_10]
MREGSFALAVLGDFYDASGLGLILISYDSFHAISIPALVYPISVGEQFSHDHGLAASNAVKCPRTSLVEKETEINTPSIGFFLHVLSIGEGERLPVGCVLRCRFVLEIAAGDHGRAVAFCDINRVLGIGHLDPWAPARSCMAGRDTVGIIMMNGRMMSSGHC